MADEDKPTEQEAEKSEANTEGESEPPVKEEEAEADTKEEQEESAEEARIRLENEIQQLEAEKEAQEQQEKEESKLVEMKAEEMARLINQNEDSSEDEKEEVKKEKEVTKDLPFFDLCLNNLLVGIGSLTIDDSTGAVYCGSCQKDVELESVKFHVEGDGHKLNTLWNYDKSLAEVTGGLRQYPQKFEMEMFKHITMLNRMEKRHVVPTPVEVMIRELYPVVDKKNGKMQQAEIENTSTMETEQPDQPEISPEELAEIKAEFIGSFPSADDAILVQQALMGELSGYTNQKNAMGALKVAGMLGKMICGYQRKNMENGYKVNEDCIRDIKEQCSRLLKLIDESRIQAQTH